MSASWPPSRLNVKSFPAGASRSGPSALSTHGVCACGQEEGARLTVGFFAAMIWASNHQH
jgi:hypothetical protein